MQTVFWTLETIRDLPEEQSWLSTDEKKFLETLRFPKRRQDWLLGRWTAKNLLQKVHPDCRTVSTSDISILKAENGAPYARIGQNNLEGTLSLTHREQVAAAAWCHSPAIKLGIDLEEIEAKQDNFINDYFTKEEAARVFNLPDGQRALAASLIWSAKEAVLKALQTGLSIDTRQIEIRPLQGYHGSDWQVIPISRSPSQMKHQMIYWKKVNNGVLTVAMLSDEIEPENINLMMV